MLRRWEVKRDVGPNDSGNCCETVNVTLADCQTSNLPTEWNQNSNENKPTLQILRVHISVYMCMYLLHVL